MMQNDLFPLGLAVGVCITAAFFFWLIILQHDESAAKAIEAGCAHYDAKTGDFTWNTPPEVSE